MRLFGKYGLEIKDHELLKEPDLNKFSPLYNNRQQLSTPATTATNNDLLQTTFPSYNIRQNEISTVVVEQIYNNYNNCNNTSGYNLVIAKNLNYDKIDIATLVNIVKLIYWFVSSIFVKKSTNSVLRFIDRKFNEILCLSEVRSSQGGKGKPSSVVQFTLCFHCDQCTIYCNFKTNQIFAKCRSCIITTNCVYNNVCDIFCTKNLPKHVEFDIGIDIFPNHNQYFSLVNNRTRYFLSNDGVNIPNFSVYNKLKCLLLRNLYLIRAAAILCENQNKIINKTITDATKYDVPKYVRKSNKTIVPSALPSSMSTNYESKFVDINSENRYTDRCRGWWWWWWTTWHYTITFTHFNNRANSRSISKYYFYWLFIVLITCVPIVSASLHNIKYSTNIVKTKYGPLRGIVFRLNPTVEAYLGVPYATPPVGSLRFMPPVTPSTWRNTKLADRFSPVCPQVPPIQPTGPEALLEVPRGRLSQLRRLIPLLANQSEDCLYLNLYVPRPEGSETSSSPSGNAMATIVYVHGESYEWNSGNPYDGSILAAHGNVIVVTINFRLGVLGFLKTGAKGSAQGNFGLMDLVAGLHWLRENLPAFNGDPNKVTLMGHGTGASLANILIVSPVASDLIHRAILLSGSALSPWAIQKDPLFIKRKVAERTGCHGDLLEDDLAPCLRTKSVSELLSITIDSPRFLPGFAPFIDGTVIINPSTSVTSPLTLPAGSAIASTIGIELADFPTKELLFGLTTIESYLDLSAQDLEFGFNETRRDRILRTYVRNVYHYHLNEIYSALKNEYTDWERPPRNPMGSRDASLELLSDGHTAAPLVRLGYLHSLRGGRSYFLHFRHQSGERDFPQRAGSVRGEDVPFCLGLPITPLFPHNYTKQDIKISTILVQYIANFAQSGNPNEFPSSSSSSSASSPDKIHTFTHNHIVAVPPSGIQQYTNSKMSAPAVDGNSKKQQKRQTNFKRHKRNHDRDDIDNSESDEVDETDGIDDGNDDEDEDEKPSGNGNTSDESTRDDDRDHRDRLDDTTKLHVPFWDTYDSINQLYLEMGNKIEIRNHYRGHKLSMWLSLIPQLHSPGDLAELSMRHHHFLEESAQYYDGIVRPQTLHRPSIPKIITVTTTSTTTTTTTKTTTTTRTTILPRTEHTSVNAIPSTTTECPPNSTIVPTLAATRPQQNQAINSIAHNNNNNNNNNNLLRRLANTHYQSYTTALTVTIAVGCFLLLLNILIFAGIYYQREKRAHDAKKKEELIETEVSCSPLVHGKCGGGGGGGGGGGKNSRKSSLQSSGSTFINPGGNFGEYSCYDEKVQCKKHTLADICSVELPMQEFKCTGTESNTSSLRRSGKSDAYTQQNLSNLMQYPPIYSSPNNQSSEAGSSSSNGGMSNYHPLHKSGPTEQCNQATQSDMPDVHDVGTVIMENDMDLDNDDHGEVSPGIPDPPPPPRSSAPFQPGILRQQGGPTTPASSKKRVQIQEISV